MKKLERLINKIEEYRYKIPSYHERMNDIEYSWLVGRADKVAFKLQ